MTRLLYTETASSPQQVCSLVFSAADQTHLLLENCLLHTVYLCFLFPLLNSLACLLPCCSLYVFVCVYIYIFYGRRGVHGELLTSLCPCPTTSPPLFALFLGSCWDKNLSNLLVKTCFRALLCSSGESLTSHLVQFQQQIPVVLLSQNLHKKKTPRPSPHTHFCLSLIIFLFFKFLEETLTLSSACCSIYVII